MKRLLFLAIASFAVPYQHTVAKLPSASVDTVKKTIRTAVAPLDRDKQAQLREQVETIDQAVGMVTDMLSGRDEPWQENDDRELVIQEAHTAIVTLLDEYVENDSVFKQGLTNFVDELVRILAVKKQGVSPVQQKADEFIIRYVTQMCENAQELCAIALEELE